MALTGGQKSAEEGIAHTAPPPLLRPTAATPHYPLFDRLLACMSAAGQGVQALCLYLALTRASLEEHIVRLGLATPHDRPMRRGGPKAWSLMDTLRLIIWRLAGVHPEVIGQRLDVPRTANAVRSKARRMGLPCPKRADLHRPEGPRLRDPDAVMLAALMKEGSPADLTADQVIANLRDLVLKPVTVPVVLPTTVARRPAKSQKSSGQRELPFFGIVPERREEDARSPLAKAFNVPADETKVDFAESFAWFASLRGKFKPQTNRVAVWIGFMLVAGGLHYKEAAKKLGVTPAAFRTFRTRVGIPSDPDRAKMGATFDFESAKATLARSGYELRRCLKSDNWFWVKKTDRGVRYSPQFRTGERIPGDKGNKFTIFTRAMLEEERCAIRTPFANYDGRMLA